MSRPNKRQRLRKKSSVISSHNVRSCMSEVDRQASLYRIRVCQNLKTEIRENKYKMIVYESWCK